MNQVADYLITHRPAAGFLENVKDFSKVFAGDTTSPMQLLIAKLKRHNIVVQPVAMNLSAFHVHDRYRRRRTRERQHIQSRIVCDLEQHVHEANSVLTLIGVDSSCAAPSLEAPRA
jgi:hypothetical protein